MFIVDDELRKVRRKAIALPVRVEVMLDRQNIWTAETTARDVSVNGAGFSLKQAVRRGSLLRLTLPMPGELRRYGFIKPEYAVWAVAQRCLEVKKGKAPDHFAIGVAFIGKDPPLDYLEHPTRLYQISPNSGSEDGFWKVLNHYEVADHKDETERASRPTRLTIPEELLLEPMDDSDRLPPPETTITENIRLRGAAVLTQMRSPVGSFLRVTSPRHKVTLISIVRAKRTGADGMTRLHLEFIDSLFPLEGIL